MVRNFSMFSAGVAAISLAVSVPAHADTIDFSQFTPSYTGVGSLAGTTADGVGFTVAAGNAIEVRVQSLSWNGNFGDGEHILFNTGSAPTVISFASAVSSIGNIGLQRDIFGPYTATLQAFDALGNLLGSTSYSATSSYAPDSQTAFSFAADGIRSIALSSTGSGGYGIGFVPSAQNAVPEPSSWAMMLAGFCIAGTVLRRTSRQIVSFA